MSADYVARLERGDGPQPSEPMLAAITRGLRLTPDERDHLFLLAGHRTARRDRRAHHVSPGRTAGALLPAPARSRPEPVAARLHRHPGYGEPRATRPAHGDGAFANQWNSAAGPHYRAADPSRLGKDEPLYTV